MGYAGFEPRISHSSCSVSSLTDTEPPLHPQRPTGVCPAGNVHVRTSALVISVHCPTTCKLLEVESLYTNTNRVPLLVGTHVRTCSHTTDEGSSQLPKRSVQ